MRQSCKYLSVYVSALAGAELSPDAGIPKLGTWKPMPFPLNSRD